MITRRFVVALVALAAFAGDASAQSKSPLENAKTGQWVLQKSTAAGNTTWLYQWVKAVEGKKITLRTQILNADGKTGMMAGNDSVIELGGQPSTAPAPGGDAPKPKITDDEVELKGKKLKCKKTEIATGPSLSTTWTSDEVPVTGLVKMVAMADGKESMRLEVVDYGATDGADKPVAAPGAAPAPEGGEGSSAPAATGGTFKVGDRVAAKFTDGRFYGGKVAAIDGDKFEIGYDDGDKLTVGAGDLVKCAEPSELSAGQKVAAVWTNGLFYKGTLGEKKDDGWVVQWDDGSEPLVVAVGKIVIDKK
jgi:hypothetical protein